MSLGDRIPLILGWYSICTVDHHYVGRDFPGIQSQPQLLLNVSGEIGRALILNAWRPLWRGGRWECAGRPRGELQLEIEIALQAGSIADRHLEFTAQQLDQSGKRLGPGCQE